MIKTVFFDLDNTLLDFAAAERAALTQTLQRLGIAATSDVLTLYSEINEYHWKQLEKGLLTREEVKVQRYRVLFEKLGVRHDPAAATAFYEEKLHHQAALLPGAKALLEALYGKYRLFVMSNGSTDVQISRMQLSGIDRFFEKVFISQQIGYNKPDVRFFAACFEQLAPFEKESAVLVGDSESSDIIGGKNAGIHTVRFAAKGTESAADAVADCLEKLPKILEQL